MKLPVIEKGGGRCSIADTVAPLMNQRKFAEKVMDVKQEDKKKPTIVKVESCLYYFLSQFKLIFSRPLPSNQRPPPSAPLPGPLPFEAWSSCIYMAPDLFFCLYCIDFRCMRIPITDLFFHSIPHTLTYSCPLFRHAFTAL